MNEARLRLAAQHHNVLVDADDAVQLMAVEAVGKASHRDKLRAIGEGETKHLALFVHIANCRMVDLVRREQAQRNLVDRLLAEPSVAVPEPQPRQLQLFIPQDVKLTDLQEHYLELTVIYGVSAAEIARTTGTSERAVRKVLQAARDRLRASKLLE